MKPLPPGAAILSEDKRYRYTLIRHVAHNKRLATFIMLNPSTADATQDDPTIRRCMSFAEDWYCGQLAVVNLFAFRATKPNEMRRAADPVGLDNDIYIARLARRATVLICAWGALGSFRNRDRDVMKLLSLSPKIRPMCFGTTIEGFPRHPLYVAGDTRLIPYSGRKS